MSYKSYDYFCDCGWTDTLLMERDKPEEVNCPDCGKLATLKFGAPKVMERARPDGHVPQGIKNLKQAAKLQSKMYDLPPDKRKELQKEIKTLQKRKD